MLYKRHKGEYKRSIMNDNWIKQSCYKCKYYSVCVDTNVLPTSNLEFIEYIIEHKLHLNKICGIYQTYKEIIKPPKILYLL